MGNSAFDGKVMMKTKIPGVPRILSSISKRYIYLRKAGLQQYIPLSHQIPSDKKRKAKSVIPESETEQPIETSVTRKKAKKQRRSS